MQRDQVTALILAGGKATRMGGVDKRELVIAGRTIFERQVEALAPCVAEIIVSSPRPIAGYRSVRDPVAGAGPLAGIAAGLTAAATPWLFVIAGDMPYVHRAFIELVLSRADDACDAVGIRIGGLAEPLCTVMRVAAWAEVVVGKARRRAAEGVIALDRRAAASTLDRGGRAARGRSAAARAVQRQCTGGHVTVTVRGDTRVAPRLAVGYLSSGASGRFSGFSCQPDSCIGAGDAYR